MNAIENLGFSKKEAEVYITVLGFSEITTTDVADKANLPRSTAKMVLENLKKCGFVNCYEVDKKACWFAISPEKVIENHRNKETDFTLVLNDLNSLREFGMRQKNSKADSDDFDPLKIIIDNLNKPGLLTDENTRVLYSNKKWEEVLGYKNEDIIGNMGLILFKPERIDTKHAEMLFNLLKNGETVSSENFELQHADTSVLMTSSVIIPINYQGKMYYLMVVESIK